MTSTSKKLVLICGGLLLLLALLWAGYSVAISTAQQKVRDYAIGYLSAYDAENFSYRRVSSNPDEVIFYGLAFDEHEFFTIERLTISYDAFEFLRHGVVQNVTLLRPSLTVEMQEVFESRLAYPDIPVDLLQIEEGEISLLTSIFGGIITNYDATIKKQDGGFLMSADYKGEQPHLKFSGSLQGSVFEDKKSEVRVNFDGIEIDTPDIVIRRSNGTVVFTLNPEDYARSDILFQVTAGSARLYGYPWANANFSLEGNLDAFRFFSGGKASDESQGEFTYSLEKNTDGVVTSAGYVFSPDGDAFYRYIIRNNPDLLHPDDQPQLMGMDEVNLNFEIYPSKRLLVYYLPEGASGEVMKRREVLFSR